MEDFFLNWHLTKKTFTISVVLLRATRPPEKEKDRVKEREREGERKEESSLEAEPGVLNTRTSSKVDFPL